MTALARMTPLLVFHKLIASGFNPSRLEAYRGSNLVAGTKRRIDGLSLQANDVDWSVGSGPLVSGPMLSLLMAMAGRQATVHDLEGEGLETLRSRP